MIAPVIHQRRCVTPLLSLAELALKRPRKIVAATLGRDVLAGAISAIVQIGYCISFAALIFSGSLAGGFSLGLAGLIMGTVITCVVVALTWLWAYVTFERGARLIVGTDAPSEETRSSP